MRQCVACTAQCGVMHHGHGLHNAFAGGEHFTAALGFDGLERQRIFIATLIAKGVFGDFKPAVDHIDHCFCRAVIGGQHMVAACGGAACGQIAVDVSPAKTVDRLLGVTDQEQRGVLPVLGRAVDAVKDAELQRRGVLKFVDHRHRELLAQALRQALARFGVGQRHIEALEHVGKTEQTAAPLELGHALQHMGAGVQAGGLRGVGQGQQSRLQIGIGLRFGRQVHVGFAGFAASQQTLWCETVPAGFHGGLQDLAVFRALGPGFEHLQPSRTVFVTQLTAVPAGLVVRQLPLDPAQQVVGFFNPPLLECRQLRFALGQRRTEHLRQRARRGVCQRHGHQGTHVFLQRGHIAPNPLHLRHQRCGHGVELLTPVVLHGLQPQRGFVADQLLFKQAAAVKGVLAQHALAPGVDGVDGRIVHGLRGQRQSVRCLFAGLAFGVFAAKLLQKRIVRFSDAPEYLRRLGQAGADAV